MRKTEIRKNINIIQIKEKTREIIINRRIKENRRK